MPLPLPNLDDRRWADLVEEGRALIPRHARQWTNHNVANPGVTLVELFAWMTESSVYALNRITPQHRMKFLSLLGFAPGPPRPAQTMLALRPSSGSPPFTLPPELEFLTLSAAGATLPFRTLRGITVSDVRLGAIQVDAGTGLENRSSEWRNRLPVAVFGGNPPVGAAVYFGFEAIPLQTPVTLALRWDRPGDDPPARARHNNDERLRLTDERISQHHACRKPLPDFSCQGVTPPTEPPRSTPRHHSARVDWEVFTGSWTPLASIAATDTPAQGEVVDDTRSLTLDGLVEINLPASTVVVAHGAVATPLIYVRCRLAAGAYDAPPTLLDIAANAVPAEQSVPLAQRFTIRGGVAPAGPTPTPGTTTRVRISTDAAGVVTALTFDPTAAGLPDVPVLSYQAPAGTPGHVTLALARVGRGNGLPDQTFALPSHAVVVDELLTVRSHDGVAWRQWEQRPAFHGSTRTDWHFTLDAAKGVLTFGDGEHGRVLGGGHSVFVTAHVTAGRAAAVTAGAAMRVNASAVNDLLLTGFPVPVNVLGAMTTTAWPAAGGTDQESLTHAAGRAAEVLHAHERVVDLAQQARTDTLDQIEGRRVRALTTPTNAVSLLDLERMALDVPGTRVARARAWPDIHARFTCLTAPGSVTLVVVPAMPIAVPQPSPGLLRAIARYLNRRRMVTTMLSVVGPTYLAVRVRATVHVRRGTSAAEARERIERALNAFLDPLKGGPDGLGWPFGRTVYRAEILQSIDGVPGVDHVSDLTLSAQGGAPQCGNITLCPTWLAAAAPHDIRIE